MTTTLLFHKLHLFQTHPHKVVEVKNRFKEAKKFEKLSLNNDSEIFRNNSLFLTSVAAMGGIFAKTVLNAIGNITVASGLNDPRTYQKIM
jgi:hypothetical protein